MPPDRKRGLTREVVLRHFERHCDVAPVLLMVEDAHWMDGATEDFLISLFDRMRDRPLMALITTRPNHRRRWADRAGASEMTLDPLPRADAKRLIGNNCRGRRLPPAVFDEILARTDGVPLFIEELTAMILESRLLREEGSDLVMDGPLPTLDIPSTLRDSLVARLDRLSDIKNVARIASALGREFTFSLLAQVSEEPPHHLVAALDRLVEAQLLFQRGVPPEAEYVFKHALVQQAAYDSQLRSDRQALHARIVRAIEAHQPETALHEPGLMAHHCELAGMTDREVDYLYAAGVASTRIVAIPEALSYFSRADAAIARLEPNPRNARRNIDIILGMMEVGRFAILPSRLRALSERALELSRMEGVASDATMTAAIMFQDGRTQVYLSRYAEARSTFQALRRSRCRARLDGDREKAGIGLHHEPVLPGPVQRDAGIHQRRQHRLLQGVGQRHRLHLRPRLDRLRELPDGFGRGRARVRPPVGARGRAGAVADLSRRRAHLAQPRLHGGAAARRSGGRTRGVASS